MADRCHDVPIRALSLSHVDSPRTQPDQVFTTWQSSALDGHSHGVTDEEFAAGARRQQGMYLAVCGAVICLADSFEAPGRRCPDCVDTLNGSPVQDVPVALNAAARPRRRFGRRIT